MEKEFELIKLHEKNIERKLQQEREKEFKKFDFIGKLKSFVKIQMYLECILDINEIVIKESEAECSRLEKILNQFEKAGV